MGGRILVTGPCAADLRRWTLSLGEAGFVVRQCDAPERLASKAAEGCDLVFIGLYPAAADLWLTAARQLHTQFPLLKLAVVAVDSSEELAIQALRARVDEYVREDGGALTMVDVARALARPRPEPESGGILGESESVRKLREGLKRVAKADCNVLITGESGTGKELAAAAIHTHSSRSSGRLVSVNCAAIPEALVESELFGRERGAFTGADSSQDGKIKAADGGVIFLDEIGDLSLFAQAKILRAVETKEIYRLGSHKPIAVNVRIVAATHRDLEDMMRQGLFRQDLYFRLNVGRIRIPPLRERIEDLHILVTHYLALMNRQMGTCVKGFSEKAWDCLVRYSWPGNIRELRNLVESLLVNTLSAEISAEELPGHFRSGAETRPGTERDQMVGALLAAKWNKSKAAEKLHWSRMKLYRKMSRYCVNAAGESAL